MCRANFFISELYRTRMVSALRDAQCKLASRHSWKSAFRVFTGRRLAAGAPVTSDYTFEFNSKLRVDGDPSHWSACLNDTRRPNLRIRKSGVVYQTRPFHVGEELGFHYGGSFWQKRTDERV